MALTDTEPLLDPAFLGRLERLQLATRRPLAGRLSGEHRSKRHGTSLDFADYRTYQPGDDYRRIDFNLWARLDVLALKLFEADDDLHVRLLVDASASMASGGKLRQAVRLAAALGFAALVRRDSVSVFTFPARGPAPTFVGRGAAAPLFAHLESLSPQGETPFAAAVADLLRRPGQRGITIVFSDLMTPEWETTLSQLPARGDDLMVIQVVDPAELNPVETGDLELIDRETGQRLPVSLSPETLDEYRTAMSDWVDAIALRCGQVNAAHALVRSDEPIEPLLLATWRNEGILR